MSRQVTKTVLFLAGVVLFISAAAFAEKGKTVNVYTDSVLPSGQKLKAGKYQVDVNEASKQVTFKQNAKVVATSGCQIVEKPAKNACDEVRFGEKENKQELQELRFGGEHRSILLIQGGS
jgi:hypothetical protein